MQEYKPRQPTGVVEDFTVPFLWMAGLLLFMGLFFLWAIYGYLASLITAGFVRWGIALIPKRD